MRSQLCHCFGYSRRQTVRDSTFGIQRDLVRRLRRAGHRRARRVCSNFTMRQQRPSIRCLSAKTATRLQPWTGEFLVQS
jgi:hypothetical protein